MIPTLIWWFFGSGREQFIRYFENDDVVENDAWYEEDEIVSGRDTFSEATSIAGSSSAGGYEVKFKPQQEKMSARDVQKNRRRAKKSETNRENSLMNVKPKRPPPQSRKRLKKTRKKDATDTTCCTEVNVQNCGITS